MLHVGLFEDFKSETRTVLCSGSSKDMERLLSLVTLVHSGDQELAPLHSEAAVAPNHPIKLFAARSLPKKRIAGEFVLLCSGDVGLQILDKIQLLTEGKVGHQYFELSGNTEIPMISANEYNEAWWANYG